VSARQVQFLYDATRAHSKDRTVRPFLTIAILCLAGFAHADDWANGNAAFARGDLEAALAYFESARDAGLTGPAVHYNIAVCQYELGRWEASGETFALIAREFPGMAGLASYNLGLVARRQGQPAVAIDYFLDAYRLSENDTTIRTLASNQLGELEPEAFPSSRWAGAFGARAGYDDNVALRDVSEVPLGVTTESPMLDAFASVAGPYAGSGEGLRVEGSLYAVRYFDADEFDQNEINAGGVYEWRPNEWRIQLGAGVAAGWLGGDPFDRRIGLNFNAYRYLGENVSVGIAWFYDDVREGDDIYAGIAGRRSHAIGRLRWFSNDGRRFVFRIRHERNHRLDPGVSPTRSELTADYRFQPERGWGYEAGASYRRSRFADLEIARTEDLWSLRCGVTRRILEDWTLLVEYRYANNDSSDATFSYDRNVLTVGALRTF
jgi:tetratricopeptide (TPR) repeat protein